MSGSDPDPGMSGRGSRKGEELAMEMRRLEVFCKVVELGSFTRAAEDLQLSQPTVSEHVRALETALGERMIDRLGRKALPTPAGKLFYRYARNILRLREEALQAISRFRGEISGRLVLVASTIPGTYVLPRLMALFKSLHPAVRMTVRVSDSEETARAVLEGPAEAGLTGSPPTDKRLVSEQIFEDQLCLTVSADHPWAKRSSIQIEELAGEPFIMREPGSGTRSVMTRMLEEHGLDISTLDVTAEVGSTEAVLQGIKQGMGVSIVSRRAVDAHQDCGFLATVEIEGLQFTRPLYLVQRRGRQPSPVCTAFLEFLRSREHPAEELH